MAMKPFNVEVPDGQHLNFSRDTDGAYRAHLFSDETNNLVGHAELFEPDEAIGDSPSEQYTNREERELTEEEIAEALEGLIALAIIVTSLAIAAAPHVKNWWNNHLLPAARSSWQRLELAWSRMPKPSKTRVQASQAGPASRHYPATRNSTSELNIALEQYRARMTSSEARERFVAALLARAYSDAQMKMLRSTEIEDSAGSELTRAMGALTPQEVGKTIRVMLEKNPSLLDNSSLTELGTIFRGSQVDGTRAPLRIELPTGQDLTRGTANL